MTGELIRVRRGFRKGGALWLVAIAVLVCGSVAWPQQTTTAKRKVASEEVKQETTADKEQQETAATQVKQDSTAKPVRQGTAAAQIEQRTPAAAQVKQDTGAAQSQQGAPVQAQPQRNTPAITVQPQRSGATATQSQRAAPAAVQTQRTAPAAVAQPQRSTATAVSATAVRIRGAIATAAVDQATRDAAEAVRLQQQGDTEKARAVLQQSLRTCPEGGNGVDCRTTVRFSMAQIERKQAPPSGAARTVALRKAAQNYEQILEEAPASRPAIKELVLTYRGLGEPLRVEPRLIQAMKADPGGAADYSLLLGDLYAGQGNWTRARANYTESLKREPQSQTARLRLLAIFRAEPGLNTSELLQPLRGWEEEFPEVARDGYRLILERNWEKDPRAAEEALVHWVELSAREGLLRQQSITDLPSAWNSAAAAGLRAYLTEPRSQPAQNNWWLQDARRRDVLAQAALSLGHNPLVTGGRPQWSERCWTVGLDSAPKYGEYAFGGEFARRGTRLDLASSIAELYANYPEMDPGFERFLKLERDLFEGKASAYEQRDLTAIQRNHETLGRIYAGRKIWEPSDHPARNVSPFQCAFFQLKAALDTAQRREREGTPYQPLAEIWFLLAEGRRAKEQTASARDAYLGAAQAFLDSDDFARAQESLKAAPGEPDAGQAEALRQLAGILNVRRMAFERNPRLLEALVAGRDLLRTRELQASGPQVSEEFLARQRFKLIADLGRAAAEIAAQKEGDAAAQVAALAAASTALALATGEGQRGQRPGPISLVGTSDLVRLRSSQAILQNQLGFEAGEALVRSSAGPAPAEGQVLKVSNLSGYADAAVQLDTDALLGARIVRTIGAREFVASGAQLAIDKGVVVISPEQPSIRDLAQRIQGVQGVASVQVINLSAARRGPG